LLRRTKVRKNIDPFIAKRATPIPDHYSFDPSISKRKKVKSFVVGETKAKPLSKEQDPHGLDPHDAGAKLDEGKPEAELLLDFGLALIEVSKVLSYGRKKYSRSGWTKVSNGYDRYTAALFRHLFASNYRNIDNESGLMHDAQVAWNALARLEMKLRDIGGRTNVD